MTHPTNSTFFDYDWPSGPFAFVSWGECVEIMGVTVIDGALAELGLNELTSVAPYLPPGSQDGRWLLDVQLPHQRIEVAGHLVPLYA